MHAAKIPFGGGVSPRFTRRLRGQSTAEYVLIIAIIGLVVLVAGPWVSSAIRNQFNVVTESLNEGTSGNAFKDPVDIPDPKRGTAFAVYSEDDNSLMFYKRRGVPKVGDMFNNRRVTAVYTGFESARYSYSGDNCLAWTTSVPWQGLESKVMTAVTVDEGIKPKSISLWFYRCSALKTVDLSKMDLSKVVYSYGTFFLCRAIESINFAPFGQSLCEMGDFITYCDSLESLDLSSSNLSGVGSFYHFARGDGNSSLKIVRFPTDPKRHPKLVYNMSFMFADQQKLEKVEGLGESGWNIGSKTNSEVNLSSCFLNCKLLSLDCSAWHVSSVTNHSDFNVNAPNVISPRWADKSND